MLFLVGLDDKTIKMPVLVHNFALGAVFAFGGGKVVLESIGASLLAGGLFAIGYNFSKKKPSIGFFDNEPNDSSNFSRGPHDNKVSNMQLDEKLQKLFASPTKLSVVLKDGLQDEEQKNDLYNGLKSIELDNVEEFQQIMNDVLGTNLLNDVALEKISGCLKRIIANLQTIETLIHTAGRRHVENMGYKPKIWMRNNMAALE